MSQLPSGPIDQIGYVVADLDESVRFWEQVAGVGPWMIFRDVVLDGVFEGRAVKVGINVALSARGDTQIELIEPVGEGPSPYLEQGKPILGVHHVAWIVDDLDKARADALAAGLEPLFDAHNEAVRVSYLTSAAAGGARFELIEGEGSREMLDQQIRDARAWKPPVS